MAVVKSPDWLPAGWVADFKKRKNGRKDWFYINFKSGYKCRTKDEVISCVRMQEILNHTSRPVKKHINLRSQDTDMTMEELPKWLPAGWTMEIKTRKSGLLVGKKYKCYIDPLTACKFYSKNEVFSFLKTQNCCRTSKPKKRDRDMHSSGDVVVEKVTEDELPPGRIKEIKVGKKNDKIRKDPVVAEKVTADGLPSGWIKEVKVRKIDGKIKRDPYYTDPVTGYIFRSRKDVFRYLETGIVGRLAYKRKERGSNGVESLDDEISPPIAAKRQKLGGSITRRSLVKGQSSKLNETKEEQILESSVTEDCIPLSKHSSDQCGDSTHLGGFEQPVAEDSKKMPGKRVSAEDRFVSASGAEVIPEKQSLENDVEKQRKIKNQLGPRRSKAKQKPVFPLRSSKRLAGIEAEAALNLLTGDQTCRVTARQSAQLEAHPAVDLTSQLAYQPQAEDSKKMQGKRVSADDRCVSIPAVEVIPEKQPLENDVEKQRKIKNQLGPRRSKVKQEPIFPRRSSKRLAGIVAHSAVDLTSQLAYQPQAEPEANHASHMSSGIKLLDEEPSNGGEKLMEDQVTPEDCTGKIESEKPESSLILPFGDSWPDPCLEFAFKTLTGAIPVAEDNLAIQDYFQQQLQTQNNSNLELPDFGLESFCQSDLLQFDALEKPLSKQQSPVKPTFTPPANDGFPSYGENLLQQPGGEGTRNAKER